MCSAHAIDDLNALKEIAEQGNAEAQFSLGRMYTEGKGVPRDYAVAALWFRKAAKQGAIGAENSLGYMYENGEGIPENEM